MSRDNLEITTGARGRRGRTDLEIEATLRGSPIPYSSLDQFPSRFIFSSDSQIMQKTRTRNILPSSVRDIGQLRNNRETLQ
jgi:hypothetical protein